MSIAPDHDDAPLIPPLPASPVTPPCPPAADDQGFTNIDPNPGACPNPVVENTAEIEDGKPSATDA